MEYDKYHSLVNVVDKNINIAFVHRELLFGEHSAVSFQQLRKKFEQNYRHDTFRTNIVRTYEYTPLYLIIVKIQKNIKCKNRIQESEFRIQKK